MARMHHYLKTETDYYQAIEKGFKKFEIRKNDRGYKVGDLVYLEEVVDCVKTGRSQSPFEIIYIMYGPQYGLKSGWCIFNWKEICNGKNELLPCPFCSEVDFDDIGLKHHLRSGYCEKYNNITLIGNEMGNALDIILGTGEQTNAD